MSLRYTFLIIIPAIIAASFSVLAGGPPTEVKEENIVTIDQDEIVEGSLLVNADCTRMVYLAMDGDKQYLVDNGKRIKEHDWVRDPVFSEDGSTLAYIVVDKGMNKIVVGDMVTKEYQDVFPPVVLSPNGKRYAFAARYDNSPQMTIVVDGEYTGGSVEPTGLEMVFSPDGKRFAYHTTRCFDEEGCERNVIVVDGEAGKPYDGYVEGSLTFSPDSKKVAYAVRKVDKWVVVVNGKEGKEYDSIGVYTGLAFGPDSEKLAYAAKIGDMWFMVADGEEHEKFDDVSKVYYNADGSKMAYWAREGEDYLLIENGKKVTRSDGISAIAYSPNGEKLVYAARIEENWHIVVDGERQKDYSNIAIPIVFSPDSSHVVYAAFDGRQWLMVVDGEEKNKYQGILVNTYFFSPGGTNFVYGAIENEKPFFVVNDDVCEPRYEAVVNLKGGKLVFDSEKEFHYLATTGPKYYLVRETIK